MHSKTLVSLLSLTLLAGCATGITLTGGGSNVRHVSAADVPVGCNLLGDVAIGIPPDAARPRTEDELVILMRNKAAEIGGTHVIIESKNQHQDSAGEDYWRGRGIAYACPEDTGPDPLLQESSGSETSTEAPAEDAPAGDSDSVVDDLLED